LLYYVAVNWSVSFYSQKLEEEVLRLPAGPVARKRMEEVKDE